MSGTGSAPDAVIFAARTASGGFRDLLRAGGMSLLERQIRILKGLGVRRIAFVTGAGGDIAARALREMGLAREIALAEWATDLKPESEDVLLLQGGLVLDPRIVEHLLKTPLEIEEGYISRADLIGLFPTAGGEIEAGGMTGHFAGAARVAARHLAETGVKLDELLKRVAAGPAARGTDVAAIPLYCASRRRDVPLCHVTVMDKRDAAKADAELVRDAESAGRPWPGRLILPYFERPLALALVQAGVAPGVLRLLHLLAASSATACFLLNFLWIGLSFALASCLLNGTARLMARLKMLSSRLDRLMAEAASAAGAFWFAGLGTALMPVLGPAAAGIGLGIAVLDFAGNAQRRFHERMTGISLEDSSALARRFSLFAARRDSLVFTLLLFAPSGRWTAGFWAVAAYAASSFLAAQWVSFRDMAAAREKPAGRKPLP